MLKSLTTICIVIFLKLLILAFFNKKLTMSSYLN